MLQGARVALTLGVDFGLDDEEQVVAVAEVVEEYTNGGEAKYEWRDAGICDC